jgi:hypothetical protein
VHVHVHVHVHIKVRQWKSEKVFFADARAWVLDTRENMHAGKVRDNKTKYESHNLSSSGYGLRTMGCGNTCPLYRPNRPWKQQTFKPSHMSTGEKTLQIGRSRGIEHTNTNYAEVQSVAPEKVITPVPAPAPRESISIGGEEAYWDSDWSRAARMDIRANHWLHFDK